MPEPKHAGHQGRRSGQLAGIGLIDDGELMHEPAANAVSSATISVTDPRCVLSAMHGFIPLGPVHCAIGVLGWTI